MTQKFGNETSVDELSYEQAFNHLSKIVEKLESEEHTLDEALALFEHGQALARHCTILLEKADLKIKQILGDEILDFEA